MGTPNTDEYEGGKMSDASEQNAEHTASQASDEELGSEQSAAAPVEEQADSQAQSDAEPEPAEQETVDLAPAGSGERQIQSGDCVSSIAYETGFFWETLWEHPNNRELNAAREDQNVLLPGDRIHVPELTPKSEACATEQRHRFRRRGEPSKLRVQFKREGRPRKGELFSLTVDGQIINGELDEDGRLDVKIPGNSKNAVVELGKEKRQQFTLSLGTISPVESIAGVVQRLANLNYSPGSATDQIDDQTKASIRQFQTDQELEATGELDETTRERLKAVHGS